MLGVSGLAVAQLAEVHDAAQTGVIGREPEVGGGHAVQPGEVLPGCQRMHEVQRGVTAARRLLEGGRVENVSLDHLDPVTPGVEGELGGGPGEAAHLMTGVEELGDDTSTDVAGGAGDEDVHGRANLGEK
jgi:hypothetical protein